MPETRNWKSAMARGARGRCPQCGEGRMFTSFLKVSPACAVCGENLSHHKADDMPPYITIFIVGHIIVGLNLAVERASDWPMAYHMVLWPLLTLVFALALMQPVKGALIAYQWALRMHGFETAALPVAVPAHGEFTMPEGLASKSPAA